MKINTLASILLFFLHEYQLSFTRHALALDTTAVLALPKNEYTNIGAPAMYNNKHFFLPDIIKYMMFHKKK